MTNSWTDIKNADVVMVIGSNTAENHPMGFKHIEEARKKGGILINVDPRFCRSSAKADIYAPMRSGTDIAFIGGMIKYAIDNGLYNAKYVKECTNALFKLDAGFQTCAEGTLGVFSDFTGGTYNATLDATLGASYGTKPTWNYDVPLTPTVAADLTDTASVFQKLKKQFESYTIDNVCAITGTPKVLYQQICETFCGTHPDDKSATILYAMGTTQHTVGTQNIRAYSILQLLLGNMGVAGGGINALRGQNNVQGATDQAVLQHILPGYLKVPITGQTLATYNTANYNAAQTVEPSTPYTVRGAAATDPISLHWWQNGTKYIASMLKAWWPTQTPDTAFGYLPKKPSATTDYTILSMFDEMYNDHIDGAIFVGENPAVSDPDSGHVRDALGYLDWLVCVDPYESETAAFWRLNTAVTTTVYLLPAAVGIEKYGSFSNSGRWAQWNWKGGNPPGYTPGFAPNVVGAKADMDILTELGARLQDIITDDPVANLSWPCLFYNGETDDALAELIAKEMHGYHMAQHSGPDNSTVLIDKLGRDFTKLSVAVGTVVKNLTDECQGVVTSITTTTFTNDTLNFAGGLSGGTDNDFDTDDTYCCLVNNFVALQNNGTTACGNWLNSGSFAATLDTFESPNKSAIWSAGGIGNRMKRRYSPDVCHLGPANDPQYHSGPGGNQIGLHSYWSWCWPINRRIVYNRAATYQSDVSPTVQAGDPLAPNKYVIRWVVTDTPNPGDGKWVGDMWDGGSKPGNCYPFIMNKDGHGHLFGGWSINDGPFPWHYEPAESPIVYPGWLGAYRMNPIVHLYDPSNVALNFATHGDPTFNIFATTYRLTEHYHTGTMTRNSPRLNELQPEPFIEMSVELANDTMAIPSGPIVNGNWVTVTSARGSITVKACVTMRFKPFHLNGTTVHQIGVLWHWGYMGLSTGDSGNILTPYIGDANMRIPESKCFRVNIAKAVEP